MTVQTLSPVQLPVRVAAVLAIVVLAGGCRRSQEPAAEYVPVLAAPPSDERPGIEYKLGVTPLRSTRHLWAEYAPLIEHINTHLSGFAVRFESALTESAYEEKLRAADFDIAIIEPHRVLELEEIGYGVIARSGNADRIAGVIVAHRNGNVRRLWDLRGRTVCFSTPGSLASAMLVRWTLLDAGIHPDRAATSKYMAGQESALMNVLARRCDAAGVSRARWRWFQQVYPEGAGQLRVLRQTEDLPGPAIMVHKRVPQPHVRLLAETLIALGHTAEMKNALSEAGFSEVRYGESASYDGLWEFLENYKRAFGPVRSGPGERL